VGADGFAVDLGALGVARDGVGRLADELTGPPRDVPGDEVFGHSGLARAVGEFTPRERRGVAWLAAEAESIRHGLAETIRTYRRTDETAARRFRDLMP
jgi:hypothetical protein